MFLCETALDRADPLAVEFPAGGPTLLRVAASEEKASEGYGLAWAVSPLLEPSCITELDPGSVGAPASKLCTWIRLSYGTALLPSVHICGLYIPPRLLRPQPQAADTIAGLKAHLSAMVRALHDNGHTTVVLCGDLNVHMSAHIPYSEKPCRSPTGDLMNALLRDCGLLPIGGSRPQWRLLPTFYSHAHGSRSTIDYIWGTPEALDITIDFHTTVMALPIDHSAVGCTLSLPTATPVRPTTSARARPMRAPFRINRVAWKQFFELQESMFARLGARAAPVDAGCAASLLTGIALDARTVWSKDTLCAPTSLASTIQSLSAHRIAAIRRIRKAHQRAVSCSDPTQRRARFHDYCYRTNSAMLLDMSLASRAVRSSLATDRSTDLRNYYRSLSHIAGTQRSGTVTSITVDHAAPLWQYAIRPRSLRK